jgi:hypothetical protein
LGKKLVSVFVPVALAVCLILADGCGAYNPNGTGSGTGTGGSDPGQAKGFYTCDVQNSVTAQPLTMETLIMPSDVFYGMIGTLLTSSFTPTALVTGQGASGNETYTGSFTEYLSSQTTATASVTANDVPGSSISGTLTESGVQTGFGGTVPPTLSYSFGIPASISTIAGTWSGALLDGSAVTLSISTSGSITTISTGCQVTGTITANTSNNLYTANLQFGPSPACATTVASQSTTAAVALIFVLPDGATQQLLMPATIGTTSGTVFSAQK